MKMLEKKLTIILLLKKFPNWYCICGDVSGRCCTAFARNNSEHKRNQLLFSGWLKINELRRGSREFCQWRLVRGTKFSEGRAGEGRSGGGRRNIESRVIGLARLNARGMHLMPDYGALIALCKSQSGLQPHSYNQWFKSRSMPKQAALAYFLSAF